VPTKTHIKLGSRISTSGDRCAYFDGSAYLLGFLFFFGRGDGGGALLVASATVVLARFLGSIGDVAIGAMVRFVCVSVY
jgi:hypothetical protein